MEIQMLERETNGLGYLVKEWPLDPDKSTIVFIHGAGGSSAFWQELIPGLSAGINTVAIDLPGRGRSKGRGKQKIEEYADAVVDSITEIGIPDPILCGLSMGGAIAQQILLDYPNRIKAAILIGTGARMKVAPSFFESIENDYSRFVDWLSKICVSQKTDPQKVHSFREDMLRSQPEVTRGDFRACDRFDVADRLAAIEAPVLVVTAEEDKLTPPESGEFLEKQIKNASRAHIMGAGHIVPVEKPDEINKTILKFLDQTGL
jgi:pimeloyl-ACP methyl ester carboxylesterase